MNIKYLKLGEIATYINGYAFKPEDWDNKGRPIIRIQNLTNSSNEINYFSRDIDEKYIVNKGDILISWSASIGIYEWTKEEAVLNQHIFKVVFNKVDINKKYYKFIVDLCLKSAIKYMHGSTMKHITKKYFDDIVVPIPNLEVQEKIAKILGKAQELMEKRKIQIECLDELVKSQFVEMFGDPVTNPMNWKKKRLADECNIITGNTPSRKIEAYYGDYIEWIKSDNITNSSTYLTTAREYLSKEGLKVGRSINKNSILMTCIAGSIKCIGNVAIADRKVAFNQQINGIEPLNNNVYFMFQQFNLSQTYIQSTINMSLKGILSKGQLSELEFIFPPIELQNQFAEFVKAIDKLKVALQNSYKIM